MASRERPARGYSRRFAWLAIAIVAVIGLYTAGWFYMASLLDAEAGKAIARIERDGGVALCANREARGYPFRIGLFCDRIGVTDAKGNVEVRGEGLRTAAQVYDPFRIIGELDALHIGYPGRQPGVSASASDMRFSASVAQPLPERASITMRAIAVDADPEGNDLPVTVICNGVKNEDVIPRNFSTMMRLIYSARNDSGRFYTASRVYDVPRAAEDGDEG